MIHPHSYYFATATPFIEQPSLSEKVDADICVIGGGIAGCSAALQLAERGYRVVLLEARRIGWGASGRSGGQALVGYASGQQTLVDKVGTQAARQMWGISVHAVELVRQLVERYRIDCDLHAG